MILIRNLAGIALVVIPAFALGGTPFGISGLYTDQLFTEAVAQAEKLGGACKVTDARRGDGGKVAQCEYRACGEEGACENREAYPPGPTIGSQPIQHIVLEASGNDAPVTRIVLRYKGNSKAVAEAISHDIGPPFSDESATRVASWSHSHRLHWQRGYYHVGLLHPSRLILLTVDREQPESAAAAR